jgi:hypothetical protein
VQNGKVVVSNHLNVHNHEISKTQHAKFPRVRTKIPHDVLSAVRRMHARNENGRTIWNYIRHNAELDIQMKDVHNLLQRMERDNYTAPTQEERVDKYLSDFTK